MKLFNSYILMGLSLGFLFSCSAEFGISSIPSDPNLTAGDGQDAPTGGEEPSGNNNTVVICDPFNPNNIIGPTMGLRGKLYSDQSQAGLPYQERATQSSHYIANNFYVADLELSSLNVPGRQFTVGFPGPGGQILQVLVNGVMRPLYEWFSIDMESKIVLKAGVNLPGLYQFAIISDDGSTLWVKSNANAPYAKLIDNEGLHPQRLKVSQTVLSFSQGQESYPMRLTYFQGPATHIAMQLFMRKVADTSAASLNEPGQTGNDLFFNTTVNPSTPTAAYQAFLERGWLPLDPGNFQLQSGTNRCINN
jgi:hypothetical protein